MHTEKDKKFEPLVVGVSTRSLFDLEAENEIFREQGVAGYRAYQEAQELVPLKEGAALPLIKNLLALNELTGRVVVEVVVMSRNSPETAIRVLNTLDEKGLRVTRLAFSGGKPLAPYIEAYRIDLFLSRDENDVQVVADSGSCAAAWIFPPPEVARPADSAEVRIAFDADAVLFSDDSEYLYKSKGLEAFLDHESSNALTPLAEGPFAKLLIKLAALQELLRFHNQGESPLRTAIVTARSGPAHHRVIHTLKQWGIAVDEAFFLGGNAKDKLLKAYGAHIFFDDQEVHLTETARFIPSGKVPYPAGSKMHQKESGTKPESAGGRK